MLKLENIVKTYIVGDGKVEALKGINLQFRENEFVAILGPSGCGKTTLLNIIGGLDRYTSGDLKINNRSTKLYKDHDWDTYRNHSIGFVFQNYNLIPHLTVLGNVELALTLSGVSIEERRKRATEALINVGLKGQLNKKPNQLSGGQMQRVAIARALVNNPDILLADEPTGALDSKTSVQIMDLLKKIAKEKLVIMVTHNPTLANQYSTRIIELFDGEVISDSNPFNDSEKPSEDKITKIKNTSMSFFTAIALSAKNLVTKKTRTIMTAFAGSIGIIGIALVLSLSNGFNSYIGKLQTDMMSSYPLQISESAVNMNSLMGLQNKNELDKYPEFKKILVNKVLEKLQSTVVSNDISEEYINNVIKNLDENLYNGIVYDYGIDLNVFKLISFNGRNIAQSISTKNNTDSLINLGWSKLLDNSEFVKSQYDVLDGKYPENYNEIALVVDEYNQISDMTLTSLGIDTNEVSEISFEELMKLEFKVLLNDNIYVENDGKFNSKITTGPNNVKVISEEVYNTGTTIKVVGILRANKDTSLGSISSSVAYLSSLEDYVRNSNEQSKVVKAQEKSKENFDNGGTLIDVLTGEEVLDVSEENYSLLLKNLGVVKKPKSILIYPVDFEAKNEIKKELDKYNEAQSDESKKVVYTDQIEILISSLNTMVNAISIVLICFTAISLVVSSIMIAIITYVSVIERTKEIGILRSVGARKKDISRVFNAETFIIGLTAGVFGVVFTMILTIPVNLILSALVKDVTITAFLDPKNALVLILISIILTIISGLVPSIIAAKKDPVIALRTE